VIIFVCSSLIAILRVLQKFLTKLKIVPATTCESITAGGRREVVPVQVHYSRRKVNFSVTFVADTF
jgi:ribosomal protein S7